MGDLEGKIIKYGDSDEERAFMIDDGEAYFGPSSGFTLDDLPDLTDEDRVTIPLQY